jgi:hypothetical protein
MSIRYGLHNQAYTTLSISSGCSTAQAGQEWSRQARMMIGNGVGNKHPLSESRGAGGADLRTGGHAHT